MKARLEFDLPDERSDFSAAVRGMDLYCALIEIDNYLRKKLKHGEHSDDTHQELEQVRDLLHDLVPGLWGICE